MEISRGILLNAELYMRHVLSKFQIYKTSCALKYLLRLHKLFWIFCNWNRLQLEFFFSQTNALSYCAIVVQYCCNFEFLPHTHGVTVSITFHIANAINSNAIFNLLRLTLIICYICWSSSQQNLEIKHIV